MKHLIITTMMLLATTLSAQSYSLADLYSLADANNRSIRMTEQSLKAAEEATKYTRNNRLPDINASLSLSYNGNGVITNRNFSNPMNVYIPEFGNNFTLQVSQVIYAGGTITNSIKLNELGERMAEFDVAQNRQEVRFHITGLYLDLYKNLSTIKVLEQNIQLTEQLIENMHARKEQGTALQNDITRYELQLETLRLNLQQLKDGCTIINHNLCLAVGLPEQTTIQPNESVVSDVIPTIDEKYWQQQTIANNAQLQQAETAMHIAEKQIEMAKAPLRPTIAFVAEDHLNGPITIEVPPIDKNFNYWFVGIGVKYNFGALYKSQHNIRSAKYTEMAAKENYSNVCNGINHATKTTLTQLCTAYIELQTCTKKVQLANENYNVINYRYNSGIALITNMIDASNNKLAAEVAQEQARINIVYYYKKLQYLAGSL